jgi:antibiotic biosynthesis monooxygenase (ABM) superfamily enzyme
MHGWLKSDERLGWNTRLRDLGVSDVVSTDLHEGIVAFMPRSMQDVAWRCVTALDDVQDGEKDAPPPKHKVAGPPPKWRSGLVIWLSLQVSVLPWDLAVAPALKATSMNLFWRIVLSLFSIVPIIKLLLLPLLDRCMHCFLFGSRCPAVEPCLTLQVGCGCCRHTPPKASDDDDDDRVAMLEQHFRNMRRTQNVTRGRLLERVEHLESLGRKVLVGEEEGKVEGDNAHHASTVLDVTDTGNGFATHESDALLAAVDHSNKDSATDSATNGTGDDAASKTTAGSGQVELLHMADYATNSATTTMATSSWLGGDDAVTVCVAYQVRRECYLQFEEWVQEVARTAATKSTGHRGAVVIQAPPSKVRSGSTTHIVVFQYDTKEHLQAWTRLPLRKQIVARLQPLLVQSTLSKLQIFVYDSLTDIAGSRPSAARARAFSPPADGDGNTASAGEKERPLRHDPQAWKISLVIVFALFVVIWFFGVPVVGPWVTSWGINDPVAGQVVHTMVGTFVNVAVLTYLLMPVLVPMSGKWLHAPWRESEWAWVRVLQRGFYCWDTVGAKLRAAK